MKSGKGKWMKDEQRLKCNQYTGDYLNDKKHGQGTFNWESGNYYVGGYVEDLRHGYGEMYWADGSNYKGDWDSGMQHGFGTVTMANGVSKHGKFENNVYICKVDKDTTQPDKIRKKPKATAQDSTLKPRMKDQACDIIDFKEQQQIHTQTDTPKKVMKEKSLQTR